MIDPHVCDGLDRPVAFPRWARWCSPGYLLRRLWLAIRIVWLSYQIHETECYLRACARDGLTNSLSLQQFRWDLSSMRCRLALLREF